MSWPRVLALVGTFGFICIMTILACGNANRSDPMGVLKHMLVVRLPAAADWLLAVTGTSFLKRWARNVYAWFFLQRNPFVMIGYFILILGGFGVFIWKAYPRVPNDYISEAHKPVGYVVMAACLATFCAAAATHPGHVTPASVAHFSRWRHHAELWPKRYCATCGIVKPARSKHCRVMNQCVSRFDHYCIWLNTAVGERNYRYFLAFLVIHVTMLWYGGVAIITIFAQEAADKGLWAATFVTRGTQERVQATPYVVLQYLMHHNYELSMCLMLCVVMGTVLAGFTAYHLALAVSNSGTNESMKHGDVSRHRQYLRRRQALAKDHLPSVQARVLSLSQKVGRLRGLLGSSTGAVPAPVTAGGPGATPSAPVSTTAGGISREEQEATLAEGETQLASLRAVAGEMEEVLQAEVPAGELAHPYDRGVVQNLLEVLFPLSDRSGALPKHPWLVPRGDEDVAVDADTAVETGGAAGTGAPPAAAAVPKKDKGKDKGKGKKKGKKGKR